MEKTFSSYIKNSKIYTLVVSGLAGSVSWANSILIPAIVLVADFIATIKIIITIIIPKIVITISDSLIKFIINFAGSTINIRPINMVSVMHQIIYVVGNTITMPSIVIGGILRQIYHIAGQVMRIPKFVFTAVMTVAVFYNLFTYDPLYFYDLDSRTIRSMDYTL